MRGVSPTAGPPPGFLVRGAPSSMDVLPAPKGYNLLAQAGVGRGLRPQPAPGSFMPWAPGAINLRQEQPPAIRQLAATSGSHEATPATPYQQALHPPRQVRFASLVTKTETATSQSQSVANRGRPQSRERGGRQEPALHSRARRDRSSTRGPKKRRGITSENPMDDLMDFIPSGWKRDLIHMVGCFYASQIAPLNSREWHNDRDKFLWVMDQCKDSEWLDIKELAPLRHMPYLARCFQETTGHHLQGLGLHTRWIRARSYYHWKVAELNQLQHCPHLRGLPVPLGPMEHPSELQQPQMPNKPGAATPGASGCSETGGRMTSGSSGKPSSMEGGAGDGPTWYEQVTHEETREGACKRKRTDTDQQAPGHPFPLRSEEAGKEAMSAIYEQVAGQEPPQKNIALRAISAYYPNFTLTAVKTAASQVLSMIAKYHLCHQGLYNHQPYLT